MGGVDTLKPQKAKAHTGGHDSLLKGSGIPSQSRSVSSEKLPTILSITTFVRCFTYAEQIAPIFSSWERQLCNQGLNMRKLLSRFFKDETGATAIEYGLIAAGISVAIIATVASLGTNLNTTFSSVSTAIK
jgi:pilus assembly protein Flp/PilA